MNMESFDSFILISEVKNMENHILQELENSPNKKNLKFYLEFNFNNFQERKKGKVLG